MNIRASFLYFLVFALQVIREEEVPGDTKNFITTEAT